MSQINSSNWAVSIRGFNTGRLGSRTEIDGGLYRVGALRTIGVPADTRVDARIEVKLTARLSAIVAGRNLADPWHTEFTSGSVLATQIPRSADLQLVWRLTT